MKRRVLIGQQGGHSSSGAIESRSLSREGRVSGEGGGEERRNTAPPRHVHGVGVGRLGVRAASALAGTREPEDAGCQGPCGSWPYPS